MPPDVFRGREVDELFVEVENAIRDFEICVALEDSGGDGVYVGSKGVDRLSCVGGNLVAGPKDNGPVADEISVEGEERWMNVSLVRQYRCFERLEYVLVKL
jgi:hypothetical protein